MLLYTKLFLFAVTAPKKNKQKKTKKKPLKIWSTWKAIRAGNATLAHQKFTRLCLTPRIAPSWRDHYERVNSEIENGGNFRRCAGQNPDLRLSTIYVDGPFHCLTPTISPWNIFTRNLSIHPLDVVVSSLFTASFLPITNSHTITHHALCHPRYGGDKSGRGSEAFYRLQYPHQWRFPLVASLSSTLSPSRTIEERLVRVHSASSISAQENIRPLQSREGRTPRAVGEIHPANQSGAVFDAQHEAL